MQGERQIADFANAGIIFTGTTFEVTGNGIWTVYAKDNLGNEAVKTINVTKQDNIAPTITLSEQNEPTKGNVTITANITDTQSGIFVQKYMKGEKQISDFTNAGTIFTGSNFEATSNGIWTVYAKDNVGNESVKTINVTKQDTIAPTVSKIEVIVPTTGYYKEGQDVTIRVTYNEKVKGQPGLMKVQFGDGTIRDVSRPSNITTPTIQIDYMYTILNGDNGILKLNGLTETTSLTDIAGNAVETNIPALGGSIITADTIAPTGEVTGNPTTWINSNATLKCTATDSGSGVKRIKFSGSSTWANDTSALGIAQSNGNYTFTIEDNAGNTGTVAVSVTKIDKENPTDTAPSVKKASDTSVTVTARQTDGISGIAVIEYGYKKSSESTWKWQSSETITGIEAGTSYDYKTRARDKAGNPSSSSYTESATTTYTISKATAVNPPDLLEPLTNSGTEQTELIPVKWDNGWIVTTEDDPEWYDYENGKWANAIVPASLAITQMDTTVGTNLGDGSNLNLYVWIPRFTYDASGSIQFVGGIAQNPNVHPAFSRDILKMSAFDITGEKTHIELSGIWVSKRQTSTHIMAKEVTGYVGGVNSILKMEEEMATVTNDISLMEYPKRTLDGGGGTLGDVIYEMKKMYYDAILAAKADLHMQTNAEYSAMMYLSMASGLDILSTGNLPSGYDGWEDFNNYSNYNETGILLSSDPVQVSSMYSSSTYPYEQWGDYINDGEAYNAHVSENTNIGQIEANVRADIRNALGMQFADTFEETTIDDEGYIRGGNNMANQEINGIRDGGYGYYNVIFRTEGDPPMPVEQPREHIQNVCPPELTSNLTPVKYAYGEWITTTEDDTWWYEYDNSVNEWANAVVGSYEPGTSVDPTQQTFYVWIPRFTYKPGDWNITFVTKDIGTVESGVHPAFSRMGFDIGGTASGEQLELGGFWISKLLMDNIIDKSSIEGTKVNLESYINMYIDGVANNGANIQTFIAEGKMPHMQNMKEFGAVGYLSLYAMQGEIPSTQYTTGNETGVLITKDNGQFIEVFYFENEHIWDEQFEGWDGLAALVIGNADNGNIATNEGKTALESSGIKEYGNIFIEMKASEEEHANGYVVGIKGNMFNCQSELWTESYPFHTVLIPFPR